MNLSGIDIPSLPSPLANLYQGVLQSLLKGINENMGVCEFGWSNRHLFLLSMQTNATYTSRKSSARSDQGDYAIRLTNYDSMEAGFQDGQWDVGNQALSGALINQSVIQTNGLHVRHGQSHGFSRS
jgi:hypothetical protein